MKATRVYKYGCRPEITEQLLDQLKAARELRTELVNIENRRMEEFLALRSVSCPGLAELEEQNESLNECIEDVVKRISYAKKSERRKHPLQAELKALKAERKPVYEAVKAEREKFSELLGPHDKALALLKDTACAAAGFPTKKGMKRYSDDGKQMGAHLLGSLSREALDEMLARKDVPTEWKTAKNIDNEAKRSSKAALKATRCTSGTKFMIHNDVIAAAKKSKGRTRLKTRYDRESVALDIKSLRLSDVANGGSPLLRFVNESTASHGRVFVDCIVRFGVLPEPFVVGMSVLMHRPLPADSDIRSVRLCRERIGRRERWTIQFTVLTDEPNQRRVPKGGTIAINIGWRVRSGKAAMGAQFGKVSDIGDKHVRVGVAIDDDGNVRELTLPARMRRREEFIRSLQSASDKLFDSALSQFREIRKAHPELLDFELAIPGREPVTLLKKTIQCDKWRSHKKLLFAIRDLANHMGIDGRPIYAEWKKQRLAAKIDLFATLEETREWLSENGESEPLRQEVIWLLFWMRKCYHLDSMARDLIAKTTGWRREIFRIWAAQFAAAYQTLVTSDEKYKELKEKKPKEQDFEGPQEQKARANQHKASPGLLRSILRDAFGQRSIVVSASDVTKLHYDCGCELYGDRKKNVALACERDGSYHDQDENAARNMLRAVLEKRSEVAA